MIRLAPIEIDEQTFLREHFALPPMPELSIRIMDRIADRETGPAEIAELISSDPALVASIFKIVNSAYYALPRRIVKINQAVAYLGLSEVNRLVLALSVMETLRSPRRREFHEIWRHSFYSALVSRIVAKRFFRSLELDGLYSAALLHDLGKLVYLRFFPDHYLALREECRSQGCLFIEAEKALRQPSHQYFGALLCDRWSLPSAIRSACEFHELHQLRELTSEAGPESEFKIVVAASNLMAHLAEGDLDGSRYDEIRKQIKRVLTCSEGDFLVVMGEVYEQQVAVADFLSQL